MEKLDKTINNTISLVKNNRTIQVYIVVNTAGATIPRDYAATSDTILTEFLTDAEFQEIYDGIRSNGVQTRVFYDEESFIRTILAEKSYPADTNTVVFNLSRNGMGVSKKALIPAFCALLGLTTTGSNAYVTSLGRNKFHYSQIFSASGISVPKQYVFDKTGWINGCPPDGQEVIAKPSYEAAARGISEQSVFPYTKKQEQFVKELADGFQQPILVQEFIRGYEIQVPLIICNSEINCLPIMGIDINSKRNLDNQILTYQRTFDDDYGFYAVTETEICKEKLLEIEYAAIRAARIIGIENYGRIDFRVTFEGHHYVTDIATHPYIIRHSAFSHAFAKLGYMHSDLFAFVIGNALTTNQLR